MHKVMFAWSSITGWRHFLSKDGSQAARKSEIVETIPATIARPW